MSKLSDSGKLNFATFTYKLKVKSMKGILLVTGILTSAIFLTISCTKKQAKPEESLFSPSFTSEIESFGSYSYPDWSVVTFKVEFKR